MTEVVGTSNGSTQFVKKMISYRDVYPSTSACIATCTIRSSDGKWIDHNPDFEVFNELDLTPSCSFCKDAIAITFIRMLHNPTTKESAGYHYCLDCFTSFDNK